MSRLWRNLSAALAASPGALALATAPAMAQDQKKPNILFIMSDDDGWMQVGATSVA